MNQRVTRKAPPAAIPSEAEVDNTALAGQTAEGAASQGITAGNPAPVARLAPQTEAEADDSPAPVRTRRSRREGGSAEFDIPKKYQRAGYDYEWKTTKVNGLPEDSSRLAFYHDQGWQPVLAKSMPELVGPHYEAKYIERMGQMLFTRPMHLTAAAKREDYEIAEEQKQQKLQAASSVPLPKGVSGGMMTSFVTDMAIEGEVGSHKAKPAAPAA